MSIANAYFQYDAASGTTIDVTMTVSSNSDRITAVQIISRGLGDNVSSVTWDPAGANESLGAAVQSGNNGNNYAYTFAYANLTSGAAKPMRVVVGIAAQVTVHIIDMYDMDTSSLTDGYGVATGSSNAPAVTFSPSAAGGHCFASALSEANSGPGVGTWSGVSGQTTSDVTDRGSFQTMSSYATDDAAGSLTMDFSTNPSDAWICVGSCFPVAAAGGISVPVVVDHYRKLRS